MDGGGEDDKANMGLLLIENSIIENAIQYNKNDYSCNICHKNYVYKSSLKKHYLTHAKNKGDSSNSNICGNEKKTNKIRKKNSKTAISKINLFKKTSIKNLKLINTCENSCDEVDDFLQKNNSEHVPKYSQFEKDENVTSHSTSAKNSKIKEECYICGQLCAPTTFKTHLQNHTNVQLHDCDECELRFTSRKKLKAHKLLHKNYIKCEACDRKYKTEEKFKIHNCIPGEKARDSICDICGKAFLSMYDVRRHIRSHTNDKPYKCGVCNRGFTQKCNRDVHTRSHFKDPNHVPVVKEKIYECEICSQAFGYKQHLKRHMLVHTGERPHVCVICQKGFIQRCHMIQHMQVHSKQMNYKCDKCSEEFRCKGSYVYHQRKHREKKIFCSICNRGFFTDAECETHYRSHTSTKPYSCDICDKKFTHLKTLERHYFNHTLATNSVNEIVNDASSSFADDLSQTVNDYEKSTETQLEKSLDIGEKSYKCNFCQQSFIHKSIYNTHYLECAKKMLSLLNSTSNSGNDQELSDQYMEKNPDSIDGSQKQCVELSKNVKSDKEEICLAFAENGQEIYLKILENNQENTFQVSDSSRELILKMLNDDQESNMIILEYDEDENHQLILENNRLNDPMFDDKNHIIKNYIHVGGDGTEHYVDESNIELSHCVVVNSVDMLDEENSGDIRL